MSTIKRKKKPGKKVRLWLYHTSLSGNANGHFNLEELPVKSTSQDVIDKNEPYYHKIFNIQDLGIFTSMIPDIEFCPKNVGKYLPFPKTKK